MVTKSILNIKEENGLINFCYDDKKNIYNSVVIIHSRDLNDFNEILKNTIYYYYSQKKNKRENYLIFKHNDIVPKLDDFEILRLSYECIEIILDGFLINIRGNYKLGLKTIYKVPVISRLLSFKNFSNNIDNMSRTDLINHIKKNNFDIGTYLKPHFMLKKEIIEYEKKIIKKACKGSG